MERDPDQQKDRRDLGEIPSLELVLLARLKRRIVVTPIPRLDHRRRAAEIVKPPLEIAGLR
jgi:hypothetical protein